LRKVRISIGSRSGPACNRRPAGTWRLITRIHHDKVPQALHERGRMKAAVRRRVNARHGPKIRDIACDALGNSTNGHDCRVLDRNGDRRRLRGLNSPLCNGWGMIRLHWELSGRHFESYVSSFHALFLLKRNRQMARRVV